MKNSEENSEFRRPPAFNGKPDVYRKTKTFIVIYPRRQVAGNKGSIHGDSEVLNTLETVTLACVYRKEILLFKERHLIKIRQVSNRNSCHDLTLFLRR